MLWQLFAEQPFSVRTEVVAHAPQSEGPILSGMGHAGTAEINDAGQQAAAGQEIRQARIPVGEARERRKRRLRLQFGQNVDRRSTEVDLIEVGLRSEEHTSELQSRLHLVCRLLLE